MNSQDRGQVYLLTGAILGLVLGLVIAWVVYPTRYVDTSPELLRAEFKDRYRSMIAESFQVTNDIRRASSRLSLLNDPDPVQALSDQAQRNLAAGQVESVQPLARLAEALMGMAATRPTPTATRSTPEPTTESTPILTITPDLTGTATSLAESPTPRPSLTPSPTSGPPFILLSMESICEPGKAVPLIQVTVQDASQQPVRGVEIVVAWTSGEDHFFTGLKPEVSLGYADFEMDPGVTYTMRLASGSEQVNDLTPPSCAQSDGSPYWGSIRVVFQQP